MWLIEAIKGLFRKNEPRKITYEVTAPAFLMLVVHYRPPVVLVQGSIGQDWSTSVYSFQTKTTWFETVVTYHLWAEDILKTQGNAELMRVEEEFFKALRTNSRNGIVLEPYKLIPKEEF